MPRSWQEVKADKAAIDRASGHVPKRVGEKKNMSKLQDLVERAGWTTAQAAAGGVAAYFEALGTHHFDWRTVATTAAVAGVVAALKVLGVNASVTALPRVERDAAAVIDDTVSHKWSEAEQAAVSLAQDVEHMFPTIPHTGPPATTPDYAGRVTAPELPEGNVFQAPPVAPAVQPITSNEAAATLARLAAE